MHMNITEFQAQILDAIRSNHYPGVWTIASQVCPRWNEYPPSRGAISVQVRRAIFKLEELGLIYTWYDENMYLIMRASNKSLEPTG